MWACSRYRVLGVSVTCLVGMGSGCYTDGTSPLGTVTAPASRITVTSPLDTILVLGDTVQLRATAFAESGDTVPGITPRWSATPSNVLRANATGRVAAIGTGSGAVIASAQMLTGAIRLLVVDAHLDSILMLWSDTMAVQVYTRMALEPSGLLSDAEAAANNHNIVALLHALGALQDSLRRVTDQPVLVDLLVEAAVLELYAARACQLTEIPNAKEIC